MPMLKSAFVAVTVFLGMVLPVHADDIAKITARSTNWISVEHRESFNSPVDLCGLGNEHAGIFFRYSHNEFQVRMRDDSWSLPPHVTGKITLTFLDSNTVLDITANTDQMVKADIDSKTAQSLLTDITQNFLMKVAVGKNKPVVVGLIDGRRPINAFLACAGLEGHIMIKDANPFE